MENLFNRYKIDCVLDVGSNTGQYAKSIRSMGYRGWIVSFEPVNRVFELLKNEADKDEKWLCYKLALGDQKKQTSINVYSSTDFSSFLPANDYARKIWTSLEKKETEEVEIEMLDNVFSEIKYKTGARNFYLKLDTQGFDIEVFRGAASSMDYIRAMQSELSLIHVYEGMRSAYSTLTEYHEKDFLISGIYPINRDESLAVIEYDCVLVKHSFSI